MAIYHYSISKLSRARGRSSVQKMSYITCGMAKDESTGRTFNYLKKSTELVHTETALPANAKKEWLDPTVLWNEVEKAEKKRNAKVAYDMDGALPNELDHDQMIELVRNHVSYLTDKGFCVTWAIHDKDDGNPHVHLLATTRPLDKNGNFTTKEKKVPVLDADGNKVPLIDQKTGEQKIRKRKRISDNGKEYYSEEKLWQTKKEIYNPLDSKELYKEIRQSWADRCNEYLPEEDKVSPLSFKEQGIEQIPSVHLGAVAKEMDQRDAYSWKMENYVEREEAIEEEKKNRLNEVLSKLLDQAEKKVQEIAQKVERKINKLGDYVQNFLKKKEEEKEQNDYPPMYKVILDQERKRKKFAEEHYKNYDKYNDKLSKLDMYIRNSDDAINKLTKQNVDLNETITRLKKLKQDQDSIREPLNKFKEHYAIYNQKIEEVREEQNKLFKNKKLINKLYDEAERERTEFNKAGDEIHYYIGHVGYLKPAEQMAKDAEELLKKKDPTNEILEKESSVKQNKEKIKDYISNKAKAKNEYSKCIEGLRCMDAYMNGSTTLEDDYKEMAYYMYDHIEGNERHGYIVHLKPLESTDSQLAYLTLAKAELRYNKPLNELLDGLEDYCLFDYQDREYLYEQCPNANDLKVVYEYGSYSLIGKDYDGYQQEIKDPKDREVKTFSYEEDAIEYKNSIKEKINSFKEEKDIPIEKEHKRDYDFGLHM